MRYRLEIKRARDEEIRVRLGIYEHAYAQMQNVLDQATLSRSARASVEHALRVIGELWRIESPRRVTARIITETQPQQVGGQN